MTDTELRVLAQVAGRSPRTPLDRLATRLGNLAEAPVPGYFHALDRLWREGFITCDDGWHVTATGWKAFDSARTT